MIANEVNEYHKNGCHFFGKLVVVDYYEEMKKDPQWGTFGAMVTLDYAEKANNLVIKKYGADVEILLSIPELVARVK